MTSEGKFIEVQGTAEGEPFSREAMFRLLDLARGGILELFKVQKGLPWGERFASNEGQPGKKREHYGSRFLVLHLSRYKTSGAFPLG